jgi:hypothetical protein
LSRVYGPCFNGSEEVDIVTLEIFSPQYVLIVRGTKTYLNMDVDVRPRIYIRQPEYWGIEVVGCLSGFGLPALAPHTVSIPLSGITGTEGIEVIGATRSERREIPPDGETVANCRDWSAVHDRMPPGPGVLRVHGKCEFPTAGYSVELRRSEPQERSFRELFLELEVYEPTGPAGDYRSGG